MSATQSTGRWCAGDFDAAVIAQTVEQLYVEAGGTHPFVAKMQPVDMVALVEHVLYQAEKQIASTDV